MAFSEELSNLFVFFYFDFFDIYLTEIQTDSTIEDIRLII